MNMPLSIFGSVILGLEYTAKSQALSWRISNLVLAYIYGGRKSPMGCKLGEHGIRKGLDVKFILINQSNGSYLHYSKIDYIKFYSALLNSKSASICNTCILNRCR